jgi:Cu-Zn family superoxide dismutase
MQGRPKYPSLNGVVKFYPTPYGTLVVAEILGLPRLEDPCKKPIFGFHIHNGGSCTGNDSDPFADTGMHENPFGCPHPYHMGDLPPLFGAGGIAFSAFLTDRFTVDQVLGKTVIIHASPDDFISQPSGNAGEKIACGVIGRVRR